MKQIKKKIKGQQFIFDYRKAIYWEDTSSLILSDVHVGKLNHFQKKMFIHLMEVLKIP